MSDIMTLELHSIKFQLKWLEWWVIKQRVGHYQSEEGRSLVCDVCKSWSPPPPLSWLSLVSGWWHSKEKLSAWPSSHDTKRQPIRGFRGKNWPMRREREPWDTQKCYLLHCFVLNTLRRSTGKSHSVLWVWNQIESYLRVNTTFRRCN